MLERFTKKNCKKQIKKSLESKKVIKRKSDKLNVKWKGYDSPFDSCIDKKDIVYVSEHFPESKSSGGRVKIELDLSNYATKSDLKNVTGVDTSKFAKKS